MTEFFFLGLKMGEMRVFVGGGACIGIRLNSFSKLNDNKLEVFLDAQLGPFATHDCKLLQILKTVKGSCFWSGLVLCHHHQIT